MFWYRSLFSFYGVFTISGQEELFEKEYIVKTYFDNTAGLLEGAYVRLSGVGVGSVSSIRFSDDPSQGKVQVVMEVNKRALIRVSTDSLATIKTEGLLGAKFVEIIPGQGESIGKAPRRDRDQGLHVARDAGDK